ncbi:MAG: sulfate adenylyltransferase subunit CysN [Acidobacteriia bacterium]|nr:sulfate adenylyltransferase subunit CysN [Terriglobia bacterium]
MSLHSANEHQDGFSTLVDHHLHKDMLRFTTAGSVDDGKSTLIGRLLHDSKSVYEDQLASVSKSRVNRSSGPIDFSLLTDGLRAEREQGITIDVAYRYFETPRRKFIIADTPGHEQYTRNMATGASTADLAVILIDATRGVLAQTRRHAYISSLLGIRNIVAAINKMDLLEYREDVFRRLYDDFLALAGQLNLSNVVGIPISALEGGNLVNPTGRMPWYHGPTLLEHLETVPVRAEVHQEAMRFPVQYVVRPDADFRGFAGRVASGTIRPGDAVMALPSQQMTRVRSIVTYDEAAAEAFSPMSVTLTLEDEIDLSRGDMLVTPENPPTVASRIDAMVVWFDAEPLAVGRTYLIKHSVRTSRAKAGAIEYRVNMNTLEQEPARELKMNDIAAVQFEIAKPLFFDPYERNRTTGSFILIDPLTNATVGAAIIRAALPAESSHETDWKTPVSAGEKHLRHGHEPALVLVESRPLLAQYLDRALFAQGFEVALVSGEDVPAGRLADLLPLSQSAGLVLIYSTGAISAEQKRALRLDAVRTFDLTALNLPEDDQGAVSTAVAALQSLRIAEGPADAGEVN